MIALRGHREQDSSNDAGKNSDTKSAMQKGNFLAIINAFATVDDVLIEHLERDAKKRQDGIMANSKWHNWMFIWVCLVKNKEWDSRLLRNYYRWGHW